MNQFLVIVICCAFHASSLDSEDELATGTFLHTPINIFWIIPRVVLTKTLPKNM